jgi:probable phosphoglycerate mutase
MPVFYFIRHGQSEANLLQQISNRGWVHPLTSLGEQQAAALAGRLASEGITAIYTSPLQRAVQTAAILGQHLGLPYTVADALREYDCGELEGRADADAWQQYAWLREEWAAGRWEARLPGGESLHDIRARFVPFIEALRQSPSMQAARLALIGHGGLFMVMLPFILPPGMPLPQDFQNAQFYRLAES